MSIKIERAYNDYKVVFEGQRNSIVVKEDEISNVVAHYYALKSHNPDICPVCKRAMERANKHMKKSK